MNKVIPFIIFIFQLLSIVRLWYVHKYQSSKIPSDFIEFIIFSGVNIIILILAYFYVSNLRNSVWLFPVSISIITIIIMIIILFIMLINKY